MKVGFPYMGQVLAYKKLLESLGHEVIMPPEPTKRTFELGVLYSPEFICYPFKIMMGTYIELCEKGAEVIISSGGSGPCRAGLYCEIHRKVLKELGYDVEIIIFDSMFQDFSAFFRKFLKVKNKTPIYKVVPAVINAMKMLKQLDIIDDYIKVYRAYEMKSGSFDYARTRISELYNNYKANGGVDKVYKQSMKMLSDIPVKNISEDKKIRIGIVGEIYIAMEPSANVYIEKRLNELGVEVFNVQRISSWVEHNILPRKINKSKGWKMWTKAEKYKSCNCGGHDMENTGWIMEFADMGYDGVIHLMPFACLPELITRSIIPQICEDLDLPILSMSIDEQTGEANTQTRLEAFVDLCRNKKMLKSGKKTESNSKVPLEV